MSSEATKRHVDVVAEGALAALRRARNRAERIAWMTGTDLIQAVDGKVVRVAPRPGIADEDETTTDPIK